MKQVVSGGLLILSLLAFTMVWPSRSAAQCCETCSGDFNCDGQVTINEIITAVNNALNGCATPVSADQACADFATANCNRLDQCVLNGTTIRYGGASTCQARQKQACLVRLGATGTGNDPSAVELCVSQLPAASLQRVRPRCHSRVRGQGWHATDGAPCAFSGQCQSANCAIVEWDQLRNLCAAQPSRRLVRDDRMLNRFHVCGHNPAVPAARCCGQRLRCGSSMWRGLVLRHAGGDGLWDLSGCRQQRRSARATRNARPRQGVTQMRACIAIQPRIPASRSPT